MPRWQVPASRLQVRERDIRVQCAYLFLIQCFRFRTPDEVLTHRLADIDPILYLLNDDGSPTTTVIIHGASFGDAFSFRPEPDAYRCWISRAQLKGRIYLLSWRSGFRNPLRFCQIEDN